MSFKLRYVLERICDNFFLLFKCMNVGIVAKRTNEKEKPKSRGGKETLKKNAGTHKRMRKV